MEKLYQIFIANDAWITIGKGIWVTVEISLASLLAGTLLGALLCFFRMGRNRFLRLLAMVYIALVRGCPVLMLLFYGGFAQSGLVPVVVAILAFSLHTAAHVAELLRSAILHRQAFFLLYPEGSNGGKRQGICIGGQGIGYAGS
ncbi:ABC transporter permease subunit [Selenomonas sp. AB3002]|uniref:ABC transporter permease subunit n=1 Tax=Selenomonas sp. AB3002 TaxID=1392502 RepID=UPI00068FD840